MMFRVYKITLFILFLTSMFPWFLWNARPVVFCFFGAVVSILFFMLKRSAFSLERKNVITNVLLLLAFIFYSKGFTFLGFIEQFFVFINIFILLNIKKEYKSEVLSLLTNGMAVIVGVSLAYYIIHLLGVQLPYTVIASSKLGYMGDNYYLFTEFKHVATMYRFKSIFAEPGHLTMGLIPLLYANSFNLKRKSVLVLLIAQLFTLSLAGYAMLLLGLIFYSFSNQVNKNIPRLILLTIVIVVSVFLSKLSEDSILYTAIVARLEFNETKGNIQGYNRTDENVDFIYDRFVHSSQFLLGIGSTESKALTEGNAGYKVYMIRFGLISLILVILFYTKLMLSFRRYEVITFCMVTLLMLFQNAYPFWFCVIFGYILGVSELYYNDSRLKEAEE